MSNHFGILLLPCVEDEIFSLCEEHLFLFINLIVVKLCSTVRFSVDGHFHVECRRIEKVFLLPISFHLLEETNLTYNSRKKRISFVKKKIKQNELSSKIVL